MIDKKSTKIGMSLYDYEHLKECQNNYKELVREIKSTVSPTNIEANSIEIKIDKAKLERLLFSLVTGDLGLEHLDLTQSVFIYE